jgi:hypothetical protein
MTKPIDGWIPLARIAQHPGPRGKAVNRPATPANGTFGFGSAVDVMPLVIVELMPGSPYKFVQGEKLVARRCCHGETL